MSTWRVVSGIIMLAGLACSTPSIGQSGGNDIFPLRVKKDGMVGFVDSQNKLIVPCEYKYGTPKSNLGTDGVILLQKETGEKDKNNRFIMEHTAVDLNGKFLMSIKGWHLTYLDRSFVANKNRKKIRLYDFGGKLLDSCTTCRYAKAIDFPGYIKVADDKKWNKQDGKIDFLTEAGKISYTLRGMRVERLKKNTKSDKIQASPKWKPTYLNFWITTFKAKKRNPEAGSFKKETLSRIYNLRGQLLYDSIRGEVRVNKEGLIALNNYQGAQLVDEHFNVVLSNKKGYKSLKPVIHSRFFEASKDSLKGVIDKENNVIVPLSFNGYFRAANDFFACYLNKNYKPIYFDQNGERILPDSLSFSSSTPFSGWDSDGRDFNYLVVGTGERYGERYGIYSIKEKRLTVDMLYEHIGEVKHGKAIFVQDSVAGQLDAVSGKVDFQILCEGLSDQFSGTYVVKKRVSGSREDFKCARITDRTWAMVYFLANNKGKNIGGPYEGVNDYSKEGVTVTENCKSKLIKFESSETEKQLQLPNGIELEFYFEKGYAFIKRRDEWGIIDSNYNVVIEPEYDHIVTEKGKRQMPTMHSLSRGSMGNYASRLVPKEVYGCFIVEEDGDYELFDVHGKQIEFDFGKKFVSIKQIKSSFYFWGAYLDKNGIEQTGVFTYYGKTILEQVGNYGFLIDGDYLQVYNSDEIYYMDSKGVKRYFVE